MAVSRELFDKMMHHYGFNDERTREILWKYTNVKDCLDEEALRDKILNWVINEGELVERLLSDKSINDKDE